MAAAVFLFVVPVRSGYDTNLTSHPTTTLPPKDLRIAESLISNELRSYQYVTYCIYILRYVGPK